MVLPDFIDPESLCCFRRFTGPLHGAFYSVLLVFVSSVVLVLLSFVVNFSLYTLLPYLYRLYPLEGDSEVLKTGRLSHRPRAEAGEQEAGEPEGRAALLAKESSLLFALNTTRIVSVAFTAGFLTVFLPNSIGPFFLGVGSPG